MSGVISKCMGSGGNGWEEERIGQRKRRKIRPCIFRHKRRSATLSVLIGTGDRPGLCDHRPRPLPCRSAQSHLI